MKLSPPTQVVFILSAILFLLALIGHFGSMPVVSEHRFWFSVAAYAVLAIGCLFKGR